MIVRRGRGDTLEADRERTRRLVEVVRESATGSGAGEGGLRVWTPPAHVSFGRRDANAEGFDRACEVVAEMGLPTTVRPSGGRAVVHTESTLAVVLATPADGDRTGIQSRYERALDGLRSALAECDVDAERGEPAHSFCPGSHSLQVDGRKVAGLAQRVRRDVATLTGIVVVRDEAVVSEAIAPVYGALDVPFDREAVGSVATAGGPSAPANVGDGVADALRDGPVL